MFGLRLFRFALKFITVALCVAFVVLNMQDTRFYYSPLAAPLELPLWGLGLVLFGTGFILGALLVWLNEIPRRRAHKRLQKQLEKTEGERDALERDMRKVGDHALDSIDRDSDRADEPLRISS